MCWDTVVGVLAIQVIGFAVYVFVTCRRNKWAIDNLEWRHPFTEKQ